MNWLDTETKELLQKVPDERPAPPKTGEFALVLLREGQDRQRLVDAIIEINKCSKTAAAILADGLMPVTINLDLSEEEALWGQFELICGDSISVFLRTEVMAENDRSYLWPLFRKMLESPEFKPVAVNIALVPETESGEKFVGQFLGEVPVKRVFPLTVTMPFKKARIMEHWATRVGAQLSLSVS